VNLPAEHRHLMTQNEQLNVLGAPPSRASWVNICKSYRRSRYTNDAAIHPIVALDQSAVTDSTARRRGRTEFASGTGRAAPER
jgi:hypothetical protein